MVGPIERDLICEYRLTAPGHAPVLRAPWNAAQPPNPVRSEKKEIKGTPIDPEPRTYAVPLSSRAGLNCSSHTGTNGEVSGRQSGHASQSSQARAVTIYDEANRDPEGMCTDVGGNPLVCKRGGAGSRQTHNDIALGCRKLHSLRELRCPRGIGILIDWSGGSRSSQRLEAVTDIASTR